MIRLGRIVHVHVQCARQMLVREVGKADRKHDAPHKHRLPIYR